MILLQEYFYPSALIISDKGTPPMLSSSGNRCLECDTGVSTRKRIIDTKRKGWRGKEGEN
jgi:hypothetical protein